MDFRKEIERLKEARQRRLDGKYNCIPFHRFPRFSKYMPGIVPGTYYIMTASSGVGKTKITKRMFVLDPIEFMEANPDCGLKLKIFYFALEESKEEFIRGIILNRLAYKYNIHLDDADLQSMSDKVMSEDIVKKIEDCYDYYDKVAKYVEVIDTIDNPTGIYKHVKAYAEANGTFHMKEELIGPEGAKRKKQIFDRYEPNDPDEIVVVVTDHVGLLREETQDGRKMNKYETIGFYSQEYCRKRMTKQWNYVVVNNQQQVGEQEKMQFTFSGDTIEKKMEPSLAGFANNKETARDALVIISVFDPSRYGIKEHLGYDTVKLIGKYRAVKVLKNRRGIEGITLGLYFDGSHDYFEELPKDGILDYHSFLKKRTN